MEPWMIWLIVGGGVLIVVLFVIAAYNGLVSRKVETENAWSQIDVQLKRRYDLIPNLVETVKGYAAHEKETLERVIQARNAAISATGVADKAAAENALTGALRQIFALSEAMTGGDWTDLPPAAVAPRIAGEFVVSCCTSPAEGLPSSQIPASVNRNTSNEI